jgi:hypothetical protein
LCKSRRSHRTHFHILRTVDRCSNYPIFSHSTKTTYCLSFAF